MPPLLADFISYQGLQTNLRKTLDTTFKGDWGCCLNKQKTEIYRKG